jgi:YVTN family beta-propeller protein
MRVRNALAAVLLMAAWPLTGLAAGYQVFVSNERSGDITIIDGANYEVLGTIPAGKRPRGIHGSPDGKTIYVALSGTPIQAPPKLDAHGNPILKRHDNDDDDDAAKSDKSADGIGVVDIATRKLTGRIKVGSDPEEFDLSKDGTRIYVSNEDVKTASVVNIATGKVEHIIPVGEEPEGVNTSPDGKNFYVTCEAGGDIYVVETTGYTSTAHFKVPPRPRSVAFLRGTAVAFIPSESSGLLNVIDTTTPKVSRTINLPEGARPMRIKISRDGKLVYVSEGRLGVISVLDAHTYQIVSSIKVGERPWGIELSPDGRFLFSANGPSNDVSVVDLQTNQEVTRVKAGASPWGVTVVVTH